MLVAEEAASVTQLARCLEAELSHTRPCCQADRTPQHLEWVKGNRARNRYGACVGHNADHREAAVFKFHQLQLIELLRIGSDGWDTKVTRALCRRVLVLPENLQSGSSNHSHAMKRHHTRPLTTSRVAPQARRWQRSSAKCLQPAPAHTR